MPDQQADTPDLPNEGFAKRRWEICKECPELMMYICKQCGCFMPAKTRLRSANCPLQKWTSEY
jgi:hypothetical protein